ncbi:MAG: hypothetical protein B6240_03600 [Desulfobacteraceae bacterium 4572_87]|nr:MAG: hypothetical protein B6240_03600 [Desulfobacteraceae bacterium 4572_87]
MARGDQLGRQWKIIQILIKSRAGKSASQLAEAIETSARTVYRDLDALQVAGFPIYTHRSEGRSLWSVLDTVKNQIPVPFTLTELMALHFSRDMLKVFKDTVFLDALESIFQKVKTTLPKASLDYLENVEQSLYLSIKPYKDYSRFREVIHRMTQAAANRKTVEMVYFTMSRKKKTRRRIDPYRVWFHGGTFYLIGFCHLRSEVRIFALDRIKMLYQTDDVFKTRVDFNVEDFMKPSFGVYQGQTVHVAVWFHPDAAGYIREKIWHPSQQIHAGEDDSIILEADVAGIDEIRFWIMSWGSKAKVLQPESLCLKIREEVQKMAGQYETPGKLGEQTSVIGNRDHPLKRG